MPQEKQRIGMIIVAVAERRGDEAEKEVFEE